MSSLSVRRAVDLRAEEVGPWLICGKFRSKECVQPPSGADWDFVNAPSQPRTSDPQAEALVAVERDGHRGIVFRKHVRGWFARAWEVVRDWRLHV